MVDTLYWVDSLLHRCKKSSLLKLGTFSLKLALLLKIALFELKLLHLSKNEQFASFDCFFTVTFVTFRVIYTCMW